MMNSLLKVLIFGCLLISPALYSRQKDPEDIEEIYKKYLENTTWIVPPSTLLAYQFSSGIHIPLSDQTVWVINEFNNGYFFGNSYTELDGATLSQRRFVGSVTPKGAVYISFYPVSGSSTSTDIVEGIGTFTRQGGGYIFTMQMNSGQNDTSGLSHWSYMISVKPEDYFYQHLPGVNLSVPEFIDQF